MPQYDNTNSGALFKNDRKDTDKHPDYKGQINVEGREFWLSAWLKKSQAGKPYMSLSVQPKEQQGGVNAQRPTQPDKPIPEDDIPF